MDISYGCLNLQAAPEFILPIEGSSFDFRRGNHLSKHNTDFPTPGDFIFAQNSPLEPTIHVPSRNEKVDSTVVGDISHEQNIKYATRLLLHINSEKNDLYFSDLIHTRLYEKLEGRFMVCLSQAGPHSRFIFLVKNIQLNMLGVTNDKRAFIIWSNELDMEERMRRIYKNEFYYYRFPSISKGSLVIHTKFICTRFKRWNTEIVDKLKIFSALERLIMKNVRV